MLLRERCRRERRLVSADEGCEHKLMRGSGNNHLLIGGIDHVEPLAAYVADAVDEQAGCSETGAMGITGVSGASSRAR